MSKKYYAVRKGRTTGIFTSWDQAKKQIDGFSGSEFKSFTSLDEAHNFLHKNQNKINPIPKDTLIAYVDGSFNKNSKRYSYGAVLIHQERVVQELSDWGANPLFTDSFQIAGECLGALEAIRWATKHKFNQIVVHYDYLGIEKWAIKEWRTNKKVSQMYQKEFDELSQHIKVTFIKVKAHSGIQYNERADQLAKQAL